MSQDREDPAFEPWPVRTLTARDVDRIATIDEAITGRRRLKFFEGRVQRALRDSDLRISLGVESDGTLIGAVLGTLQYGEYGVAEPVAVLDTILVAPPFSGRGVARALMDQLVKNLGAVGVKRLRTEIAWDEHDLLGFLGRSGFAPVPRLVLERAID